MSDKPTREQLPATGTVKGIGRMLRGGATRPGAGSMAGRLVEVLVRVGAPNLKAFYDMLTIGNDLPDGFPTYEAVRTYHGRPFRDPPTAYLARILEVFPAFDARWLLTGEGEPIRVPEPSPLSNEIRDAFVERIATLLEDIPVSPAVLATVEHLAYRALSELAVHFSHDIRERPSNFATSFMTDVAARLGTACASAGTYLIDDPDRAFPQEMFTSFALRFISAAEALLPIIADAERASQHYLRAGWKETKSGWRKTK